MYESGMEILFGSFRLVYSCVGSSKSGGWA